MTEAGKKHTRAKSVIVENIKRRPTAMTVVADGGSEGAATVVKFPL